MNTYVMIFLITALTGVGGLALGGGLAAVVHDPSDKALSLLLRFTAGVMLSVVCFDLVADAAEDSGILPILCWIMIGYLCTYLLNCWIDKRAHHTHSHGGQVHEHHEHEHEDEHEHEHEHHHEHHHTLGHDNGELCACGHHTLHTAGLVLAAAVALHNVPVGMAIGATFAGAAHGGSGGILAALIIGLHNIPEGMSITTPLLAGGSRPAGAIAVAALSGLPTILGALIGYGAGTMNPLLLAISLSFAAGAMLYVIFGELLPESEQLWQNRLSGLSTMLGMLLGMALIFTHIH